MWKDKLFWFSQPAIVLDNYDNYFLWGFVTILGLGILIRLLATLVRHTVIKKLIIKFASLFWISGLVGLVWYGLRYENTPFFADRYWVLVIVLIILIRLIYIFKYLFTSFRSEKSSFDKMQLNSRYIPGIK